VLEMVAPLSWVLAAFKRKKFLQTKISWCIKKMGIAVQSKISWCNKRWASWCNHKYRETTKDGIALAQREERKDS